MNEQDYLGVPKNKINLHWLADLIKYKMKIECDR